MRNLRSNNTKEYWKLINSESKNDDIQASLQDLFNYYKETNENNSQEDDASELLLDNSLGRNELQDLANDEINQPITHDELLKAVKLLQNNKSPGYDKVMNEYLKSTFSTMSPLILKLFNVIFDKGIVPKVWTIGNIKPIYKNKGNPKDPENYRPITLLSNFGKLFTSVINTRLNNFADKHNLICDTQAGFRKKY